MPSSWTPGCWCRWKPRPTSRTARPRGPSTPSRRRRPRTCRSGPCTPRRAGAICPSSPRCGRRKPTRAPPAALWPKCFCLPPCSRRWTPTTSTVWSSTHGQARPRWTVRSSTACSMPATTPASRAKRSCGPGTGPWPRAAGTTRCTSISSPPRRAAPRASP